MTTNRHLIDNLIEVAQSLERWKHVESPPSAVINNAQRALKTMRHTLLMRLHEQDLPPK